MRRFIVVLIFLALIAGLLIVKKIYFPADAGSAAPGPQTGGKGQGAGAMAVEIMVLQPSKVVNSIQSSGTVLANERVDLTAESAGKVTGIYFKEGTQVQAGALLVKLNDAELKAQLQKAKVGLQLAKDREARQARLLELQGTSKEDFDIAANQVLSLQAEIEYYNSLIQKTEIRAPFSGIIGFRNVALGSYVNPSTVIATLVQTNPIKIEFSVPEKYMKNVLPGETIQYTADGIQGVRTAKVQMIDPQINLETRSLKVRAIGENSGKLLPGNYVKVEISVSGSEQAIQIPTSAVVPVLKGQKVYILKEGKAKEVRIGLSDRDDKVVTVSDGLSAGDSLIVSAIIMLKDGMPVKAGNVRL